MSHRAVWRCRSCRAVLGVVRGDGALEPEVPGVTIGRDGVARVPCPSCGAVRAWRPARGGPGPVADRRTVIGG